MINDLPSEQASQPVTPPTQLDHDGEVPREEESLVKEEAEKGMDTGTSFEADKEQDLDDLLHSQAGLKKDDIPRPEDL